MEPPEQRMAHADTQEPESAADELRMALVERLRAQGSIRSAAVQQAMLIVPRDRFLPGETLSQAYADVAIPTHWEHGMAVSSASQPTMVAIMLEQLDLQPGMRVLEIGAGTGYNAALLAELVGPEGAVTTLDIDPLIAEEARAHLWSAGYQRVRALAGDGAHGASEFAPYDRIVLTAGVADISPAWVAQLIEGGLLVAPLGLGGVQASVAFRKEGGLLRSVSLTPCGFMRLRGEESAPEYTLALGNGWRLAGERVAEIAGDVARLLATRPRRRFWARPSPLFPLYMGLDHPGFLYLWRDQEDEKRRKGVGRLQGRFGVYAEGPDGPSLALFASVLPVLLIFGGPAAERALEEDMARWRAIHYPSLETWQVTAYPHGTEPPALSSPYSVRIERRHFVFDVQLPGGEATG
jgi:protein-L-isoaspartate(D-aspartate) O-methyltransferase